MADLKNEVMKERSSSAGDRLNMDKPGSTNPALYESEWAN